MNEQQRQDEASISDLLTLSAGQVMIWGKDTETEQEIGYWFPPILPFGEDLERLSTEHYAPLNIADQQERLLTIVSTFGMPLYVINGGEKRIDAWVSQEDLAHAERVPVILAFYVPQHRYQMPVLSSEREEGTWKLLQAPPGERLPPPEVGEVALIAGGRSDTWHFYPLRLLGEEGKTLWQELVHQMMLYKETLAKLKIEFVDAPAEVSLLDFSDYYAKAEQSQQQALHRSAQHLAEQYWKLHQTVTGLTQPLPRTLPIIPYVVDHGALIVASHPVQAIIAAYSNAQSGASQWKPSVSTSLPTYTHEKEAGTTQVLIRPDDPETSLDPTTIQSLWEQVRNLSDIDGDVLLTMIAQTIATQHDEKDCVWITSKSILDYRGIQPIKKKVNGRYRRAGHRQEDLSGVASCIARMSNTWIRVEQWIEEDINQASRKRRSKRQQGKPEKYLYTRDSRLIIVMDIIHQHELQRDTEAEGGEVVPRVPLAVAWRYQLGAWLDPFLQEANREVAWLLKQVLSYDPYHELWEKRLARYFTFHMRMNVEKGGTTINREIGRLIEELSLPVNRRDPEKTRQRFEKALNRLEVDGIISAWEYHGDNPKLPLRRWLETWLASSVQVTTASLTPDRVLQGSEE